MEDDGLEIGGWEEIGLDMGGWGDWKDGVGETEGIEGEGYFWGTWGFFRARLEG